MYLIRTWSYDSVLGAEVTHYWSTGGWTSRPDDTPANTVWDGRIQDPGNWESWLFTKNKTQGRSEGSAGQVLLLNLDGALDSLWNHGWGRKLEIYKGEDTARYLSEFVLLATHTVLGVDRSATILTLTFQDKQEVLAKKLMSTVEFTGTNTGTGGLEGTADDIKGKKHPTAWGAANAVPITQVNSVDLIYEIARNPQQALAVHSISDKGVPLTYNTTYSSVALLQAATTPSNKYDLYLGSPSTIAYAKLGSAPLGAVTADIEEGTSDSTKTVAQIIKRILLGPGGCSTGDLVASSFTALDSANSAVVGYWTGIEEETVGDVLDKLCASVGAFWRITPAGLVSVGLLKEPVSGEAVLDLPYAYVLEQGFSVGIPSDFEQGIPPYKITTTYAPNYTVFGLNDFAAAATEAVKANLVQSSLRISSTTISGMQAKHPASQEHVRETLLRDASAAVTLQASLVSLYGTERELAVFAGTVSVLGFVDLDSTIVVTAPRFGWNSGAAFRIIGRIHEYANSRILLVGWR